MQGTPQERRSRFSQVSFEALRHFLETKHDSTLITAEFTTVRVKTQRSNETK